jgi:hypothetical protein
VLKTDLNNATINSLTVNNGLTVSAGNIVLNLTSSGTGLANVLNNYMLTTDFGSGSYSCNNISTTKCV